MLTLLRLPQLAALILVVPILLGALSGRLQYLISLTARRCHRGRRHEKLILGFVQTGTENATTCADFLRDLVARGLRYQDGLLIVIDGSKGLRAGVAQVFGPEMPVQRCVYHKRENIVAYLPKSQQDLWRGKLERAYAEPTYAEATAACAGYAPSSGSSTNPPCGVSTKGSTRPSPSTGSR